MEHFEDKYGLAISIASAGSCLAIVAIPPLTQYMKDVFGWRGAVLIIGAMSFHIVPCGLIIPPGKSAMVADQEERAEYTPISDDEERVKGSAFLNVVRRFISTTHLYLILDVQFTAHIIGWFAGNYSSVLDHLSHPLHGKERHLRSHGCLFIINWRCLKHAQSICWRIFGGS